MSAPHTTEHNKTHFSVDLDVIQGWRADYVNVMISVMAFIGCIGLAASLTRYLSIGWLDIFYLHIVGSLLLILIFFIRHKLSTNVKCFAVVVSALAAGLAGTIAVGLAGTGIIYVIHAAMFSAIFINRFIALAITLFISGFIAVVGYLFSAEIITPSVDLNIYVKNYSSWLATLFGPILISAVFIIIISQVRTKLVRSLLQLEEAKAELKKKQRTMTHLRGWPIQDKLMRYLLKPHAVCAEKMIQLPLC